MNKTQQKFSILRKCLGYYNLISGLEEIVAQRKFSRNILQNEPQLEKLKTELITAFSDHNTNWVELGADDYLDLPIEEDTEENIKKFVAENIWNKVFPYTDPPTNTP